MKYKVHIKNPHKLQNIKDNVWTDLLIFEDKRWLSVKNYFRKFEAF